MESATPYALADQTSILRRWTQIFSGSGVGVSATEGRGGRRCLSLSPGSTISKTLRHKSSWTIGWAVRYKAGTGIGTSDIYQAANVGQRICYLRLEPDGTHTLRTENSILFNTTFSILTNNWYYNELKFTLSGSDNIGVDMEFRINGTVVGSGSGLSGVNANTLINQLATVNRHIFGAGGNGNNTLLMDMYLLSDESYWGDIKLGKIVPNGDVTTDWSATGTPHYKQVNEIPPDDDTSYIYSNTAGQVENFDWEDVSAFSGVIKGIQYSMCARKDDEGSRAVSLTAGDTGSLELVSDPFYLDDSYVYYHIPIQNNPGGGAWDVASLNAKRFGVKLIV